MCSVLEPILFFVIPTLLERFCYLLGLLLIFLQLEPQILALFFKPARLKINFLAEALQIDVSDRMSSDYKKILKKNEKSYFC